MIILDTIWLLKESNPDRFLIYFKFILGIFLIFSIVFFNQYVFKNKKKFSENFFILLIIFFITVEFIFSGTHSAFDWQSIHEIPIIKKDLNPLYLNNDFYTLNAFNTPKIVYAKIINLINILNI